MKILVLGGDGFCGWPTALHFSSLGHDVVIVDNLSRRNIARELQATSLVPISSIGDRIQAWEDVTGKKIRYRNIDMAEQYEEFRDLVKEEKPDAIVNFAEQRAAPYSMKSIRTIHYTVRNNLMCNNHVLTAILEVDPNIHLIHLGTMGVYGYGGQEAAKLPEGYVDAEIQGKRREILYPPDPGSIYHMTKVQDATFFQFYAKNYGLKITDLHQGIVWGTETKDTKLDPRLQNRFDYDGDYGTVLNRFIMQAANQVPLTVYSKGEQTRAFIHLQDSIKCLQLALENPPQRGEKVNIYNQMTQSCRLIDLAEMVKGAVPGSKIEFLDNPRKEKSANILNVSNQKFVDLGLEPTVIDEAEIVKILKLAKKHKDRVDSRKIQPLSDWDRPSA